MVHFLLFHYVKSKETSGRSFQQNNKPKISLSTINLLWFDPLSSTNYQIEEYIELDSKNQLFTALRMIVEDINKKSVNFLNVQIIPTISTYFQDFKSIFDEKGHQLPFVLCNFILPQDFFKIHLHLSIQSIDDLGRQNFNNLRLFNLKRNLFQHDLQFLREAFTKYYTSSTLPLTGYEERPLLSLNSCFRYYEISGMSPTDQNSSRSFIIHFLFSGCISSQYSVVFYKKRYYNVQQYYLVLKFLFSYKSILQSKLNDHFKNHDVREISEQQFDSITNDRNSCLNISHWDNKAADDFVCECQKYKRNSFSTEYRSNRSRSRERECQREREKERDKESKGYTNQFFKGSIKKKPF